MWFLAASSSYRFCFGAPWRQRGLLREGIDLVEHAKIIHFVSKSSDAVALTPFACMQRTRLRVATSLL